MKISPLKDADFELVELHGERPTPHCKKHEAMLKMTPNGIWRCVHPGYKKIDTYPYYKEVENTCLAGCEEVTKNGESELSTAKKGS